MRYAVSFALILPGLILAAGSPAPLAAGLFGPGPCHTCHNPCQRCHVNPCACAPPAPAVPQVQMVPQTVTVPQVSYRDVTRTEYRLQAQTQTVPVTTYQTVTVDEGSWQRVWVPRIVQKQVPHITYQQQVSYRQVPYQVTQRVPQVSYHTQTTLVPRVSHVPGPACSVCGNAGLAAAPVPVAPPIVAAPVPPVAMPQTATPHHTGQQPVILGTELQPLTSLSETHRYPTTASTSSRLAPVPDPKYLDTPGTTSSDAGRFDTAASDAWTPVRTAAAPSPVPAPRSGAPRTSAASGLFVPAPAAASVWRTRIR